MTTHLVTDKDSVITRCGLPTIRIRRSNAIDDVTCRACLNWGGRPPLPPASDRGGTFDEGVAVFDRSRRR